MSNTHGPNKIYDTHVCTPTQGAYVDVMRIHIGPNALPVFCDHSWLIEVSYTNGILSRVFRQTRPVHFETTHQALRSYITDASTD